MQISRGIIITSGILLSSFNFGAVVPAWASPFPLTDASVMLAKGQIESAGKILLNIFKDSKSTSEQRFNAAILLSAFPPGSEMYGERATYSHFVLHHPMVEERLSLPERLRLVRTEGFGWYQQGEWDKSRSAFRVLFQKGTDSDKALAQLQLGWIDLNAGNSVSALETWLTWFTTAKKDLTQRTSRQENRVVEGGSGQDHVWNEAIMRDFGRVWAEAQGGSDLITTRLGSWPFSSGELVRFQDGLGAGLSRLVDSPNSFSEFRRRIGNSPLRKIVLETLLTHSEVNTMLPCEVLNWLDLSITSSFNAQFELNQPIRSCLIAQANSQGQARTKVQVQYLFDYLSNLSEVQGTTFPNKQEVLPWSELFLSLEMDPLKRRSFLERIFPTPEQTYGMKDLKPILWWIKSLQNTINAGQNSLIAQKWVAYLLTNKSIGKRLQLKKEDEILVVLDLSLKNSDWANLYPRLNEIEFHLQNSQRVQSAYVAWLQSVENLEFKETLGAPIAARYFSLKNAARELLSSHDSLAVHENFKKITQIVQMPIKKEENKFLNQFQVWRTALSFVKGDAEFGKSAKIKLNLNSPTFVNKIKIKLTAFKKGTNFLRQASSDDPSFHSHASAMIQDRLSRLSGELSALQAPVSWPEEEKAAWENHKSGLLNQLKTWSRI